MHIFGQTNIDFIAMRKISWTISTILTLIGIFAFVWILIGKGNLSIDFAGGTEIRGSFENSVDVGTLRAAVSKAGFDDVIIQDIEGDVPNLFNVRVRAASSGEGSELTVAERLRQVMDSAMPGNKFTLDSVQEMGPTVGAELQRQAQKAIAITVIGILIYIWVRFDFRFSVAATIATFHDILAVLGIMFLLQRDMSLLIVSALLTLLGFTINDKIIVFDRIRENLRLFRKKGDFVTAVNMSINQTISRTVITSLTVFMTVLVILFVCGPVVRDFAIALAFGIVIGTYSSIFVAAPILCEWEARSPKRFK